MSLFEQSQAWLAAEAAEAQTEELEEQSQAWLAGESDKAEE